MACCVLVVALFTRLNEWFRRRSHRYDNADLGYIPKQFVLTEPGSPL